ncbi:GNAT family N-acetyltransferase [Clostridium beijerinckii]|uniref:RimJ/RimL family protein N-acetyltransferase n=1 Tax=Clostridium beijerinckii TaxID=1520 RepID=A0AAX0B586_CLOBE|nr:GNAT family protein [Clostridium beijerinckii]MBA8936246.1 RimJ/RimL family protein N-acetyltransferase [Clostridium beijerinckii]NRT90545.1 RimJ/RimL family protein N-acetyltransferase [Clostridium beijerinckii]NRU36320.1 RimJ/RimL family protein N-acetyltransferase [Clostridium beijerinckii]NSB00401.1 RimJ/RimL family protein N-acetyltransferase [Clostridium beijerinckii]NYC70070.1 RimJ/RimL family protein N-acetyltransferase [Clostridium beijerinckii]
MLSGSKVHLRVLKKEDVSILFKLHSEEKVKKYNIIIESMDNKVDLRKALSIVNEDDNLIGFVTYKEQGYYSRIYCIGITIGSEYWGRSYGVDSIKTLLRYLFKKLNATKVELYVASYNIRAIRCYKKCGFIEENIKRYYSHIDREYIDIIIMGIIRERYNSYLKCEDGKYV